MHDIVRMSSSEGSTTPLDYHISSSDEDHSTINVRCEECPICYALSRHFYCKSCLNAGEFSHSDGKSIETFTDKKMKYLKRKKEINEIEVECEKELRNKVLNAGLLKGEIELCREKNRDLTILIKKKNENILELKERISQLKADNSKKASKLNRYDERVAKLHSFVKSKTKETSEMKKTLASLKEELKKIRRVRINQLVAYIFPITAINSTLLKTMSDLCPIEDRCAIGYADRKFPNMYKIVAPTLPALGDYSAYSKWFAANKDGCPTSSPNVNAHFNPAYNISAALTYTTQLVNMLAYYLDVRLPAKLCYSDFCSNELSDGKFSKKVRRLNWNVVHLCLSQKVPTTLLKPFTTLPNIELLLDTSINDLGRCSVPDEDPDESRNLEDMVLQLLEGVSNSDDSEDEVLSYEWEAVSSSSGLPESEPIQPTQFQQMSSTSVASGLLTSTAASIASLLRWNR